MKIFSIYLFFTMLVLVSCNDTDTEGVTDSYGIPPPTLLSYSMINTHPHDTSAFTEGLTFYNGLMYEGTGSPAEPTNSGTWVASLDIPSGKYEKKINIGDAFFGEGITFLKDKMYQLTYKEEKGFVYDARTFNKLQEFSYKGEGWGLTNDGTNLIMSSGKNNLYFIQPDSLKFMGMLSVQDDNGPVDNINELEYINGYLYANKWLSAQVLKIDPQTGYVVGKLDFSKIVNEVKNKYPDAQEMNGIAYDSVSKKTFITGKKWPFIYEVKW